MKVTSIDVVPEDQIPVRSEGLPHIRTKRLCSRTRATKADAGRPSERTTEAASRPFDNQFYRNITGETERVPIKYDPTVGEEWQKRLK